MNGQMQPSLQKPTVNWNNILWVLVIWMAAAYLIQAVFPGAAPRTLTYTTFREMVRQGKVAAMTMRGNIIRGESLYAEAGTGSAAAGGSPVDGQPSPGSRQEDPSVFQTVKSDVMEPDVVGFLEKHGVAITAESQERILVETLAITLLPWLLIIGFFVYTSRKFRERMGGGGGPFAFATSRAKRFKPN